MKKAITDIFLMGVGAAALTRRKAENTLNFFVKKGILRSKQAREVANVFMKEAGKVKSKLVKEGKREVGRIKNKVGRKIGRALSNAAVRIVRKGVNL